MILQLGENLQNQECQASDVKTTEHHLIYTIE